MSYVRMPLRRKEDLKLLRGQGCYAADIRKPGMLQAVAAAVRETVQLVEKALSQTVGVW